MRRRLNSIITSVLILVFGTGPLAALASSDSPRESNKPVISRTSKTGDAKRDAASSTSSKRSGQSTDAQGRTVTLLPDGRLLVIGGEGSASPVADAVIKHPNSSAVTPVVGELHFARAWHTATMLPDGSVLIAGGVGIDGKVVGYSEVFDPAAKAFEVLASISAKTNSAPLNQRSSITPRAYHSATLLTDGRVLIAGGLSENAKTLKTAELWDPRTRAAEPLKAKLKGSRSSHTATLLSDGTVLLRGGVDDDGAPRKDADLFDPATQRFLRLEGASLSAIDATLQDNDTAAAHFVASLPTNGAIEVPADSVVALRFSKRLPVDKITAETAILSGPYGPVEAKVVPAEAGMLAFITPSAPLLPGSTYTLELIARASDPALASNTITFTTVGIAAPIDWPDDEEWLPDSSSVQEGWRSGRERSPWQSLPALKAPRGVTALAGQVLMLNGRPLANVTLKIDDVFVQTDHTGRFLLVEITAGRHELQIAGQTANKPGKTYGFFEVGVDVVARKTTVLPYTIWMPKLDMANAITIPSPTTEDVVVSTPRIAGLEVRIPRGTVIRDHEGKAVTQISITPLPLDRPPFPLPVGVDVPLYFTTQPGGAYVHNYRGGGGARLIYPNSRREPPGTQFDFWHYDPEEKGWYVYGQGRVSPDSVHVIPDQGVEVYQFTGAMVALPSTAPPDGPPPGSCAVDGDPVDLYTGLLLHSQTDLVLSDVIPISLTRTYRPRDTVVRPFGIGTTHPYELFLIGTTNPWTYIDLILPDGGRIHYDRISPGTSYSNAVYEHTSTPTGFYKSQIAWNGGGWNLTLKDGTIMVFPVGDAVTVPRKAALLRMLDRYGNEIRMVRDSDSNLTRIVSPNGRWIEFTYDTSKRITQATDNIGRVVGYQYDGSGRLWKITNPLGGVTEHTYDSSHRMLTVKNARGIVHVTVEYDSNGRVSRETLADGGIYEFAYTLDGNGKVTETEVINPRGQTRTVSFNSSGYALSDTGGCCGGQTLTFVRQAGTNFIQSVTDPLGRTTAHTYDSNGNVTSITELSGTAEAVTTSFTYDPLFNEIASSTDALGHTTNYAYDARGNVTNVTDPLGHQVTFTYNAAGQIVSSTNALNETTQIAYDRGDFIGVTNPLGHSTVRYPDSAGRVIAMRNALGQLTRVQYDSLNRPVSVVDPHQGTTDFAYDPNGNLLSVTDARSNVTSYAYNNMDRLASRSDPLMRQEAYQYDANGNLTQVTDRKSQVTSFAYDSHDRLTQVTYADASTVTYTYDAVDRVTQVVDSISGTITYTCDDLDRVTSETTSQGTVSYTYDAVARRTSMTVAGQSEVDYTYDNADRLQQITQGSSTVTIAYDNANRRSSVTLPNGVVTEYGYDAASRLTSLTYKKGSLVLGDLTYQYNTEGQVMKVGGSFARSNLPQAVTTTSYNAANHQISFGSQTLAYDLNGNLTSDGISTYVWNARDELTSMTGPGLSASFQYDAFGRRISKTINGTAIAFLYDGLDAVQEQVGGSSSANMLAGGVDEVFMRVDAVGSWGPVVNDLGSTVGLTDSIGTVQTEYTYEPFGKTTSSGTSTANSSQYTGRENDGTALYFYRARYYSPAYQRFISEDPFGYGGGDFNLYSYVGNSPLNWIDPEGLHKGDKWYGRNNKDFHKWFHRCWKQKGDPDAGQDTIEEAYEEWVRRGSPKGGRCWGGGGRQKEAPECERERRRTPLPKPRTGPTNEEIRLWEESARWRQRRVYIVLCKWSSSK